MFNRKTQKDKQVSMSCSSAEYNIDDNTMSVEISIKVFKNATYKMKDLVNDINGKENKDIRNYDIKKLTFEIVNNEYEL
jgi:uncharacterized protein YdeI (BOF family)